MKALIAGIRGGAIAIAALMLHLLIFGEPDMSSFNAGLVAGFVVWFFNDFYDED